MYATEDHFGFTDGRVPPTRYANDTLLTWLARNGYDISNPRARYAYEVAPRSTDPAPALPRQ